MINYISTRGDDASESAQGFTDVLLQGLATDGGLFIPERWPTLDKGKLNTLIGAPYADVAQAVIAPFVGDDIPPATLKTMLQDTYGAGFTHPKIAPLVEIAPNQWVLELFHGPTLAFKDYALQLLGRLFDHVLGQQGERVTIVGATSGDTGSAAIEACKSCKNIDIFILHPEGRTSEVQRRQMTTIDAPNVHNIALDGTFDDCQNMVKAMFNNQKFRNDINLSAVNSINWARIMAQIVYYVSASLALGGADKKLSFAVPTGNFGNIYAAYAAQQMGLPIDRLIIGSNRNDILTRFFETGTMKTDTVEPSLSPSMDIQISSNFERYLYDLVGRDAETLTTLMDSFKNTGEFSVSADQTVQAQQQFSSYRCNDNQTRDLMASCYKDTGYLLDPHTAVGLYAARQAQKEEGAESSIPLVTLACAHPAKFPDAVEQAVGFRPDLPPHLADLYERKEFVTSLDNDLEGVKTFIKSKVSL